MKKICKLKSIINKYKDIKEKSSKQNRVLFLPFTIYFFRGQKGFTLIELLLYIGIFTILLTVFMQMFGNLIDTQLESNATTSVNTDAKYILARFTYDMRQAQSISYPGTGVSGQSLQLVQNGSTVIYASNSGSLIITNANGTDKLNSSETSISNLSFTTLGSGTKLSVKINLTLSSRTLRKSGNSQTEQLQTTIALR